MKKKALLAILTALLLAVSFPSISLAADATISADDSNYNLASHGHGNGDTVTIASGCKVTLVGGSSTTYTNFKIVCGAGVKLTLSNVNIDGSGNSGVCPLSFTGTGNTLTLASGTTSTLSGGQNKPAVCVNEGSSLTIDGSGALTAAGGENAPGIGSGECSGTITIAGGTITACGGDMAPGIGCGYANSAVNYPGDVAVTGGTVYAYGGDFGAGIGSGYGGGGVSVALSGGAVYAGYGENGTDDIGRGKSGTAEMVNITISDTAALFLQHDKLNATPSAPAHTHYTYASDTEEVYGAAIPSAWTPTFGAYLRPCTLTYDLNGGSGTAPAAVSKLSGATVIAPDGSAYTPTGYVFDGWYTKYDGSGTRYAGGASVTLESDMKLYAFYLPKIHTSGTYSLGSDIMNGDVVDIAEGLTVTIAGSSSTTYTNVQIRCGDSVKLTLSNVAIDNTVVRFNGSGNTLTIPKGTTSTLSGGADMPAIHVSEWAELTIGGEGSLHATGGNYSAGIGSNASRKAGTITISGGTVTAEGNGMAPGIGGMGVTVNLTGGTVFAGCGAYGSGSYDIGPGPNGGEAATNISGTVRLFLRYGIACNATTTTHTSQSYPAGTTSVEGIGIPSGWTDGFGAYLRHFTLTYDANGGTGTKPAPLTKLSESTANLAAGSGLSKTGCVFSGWNTAANGSGTVYAPGGQFTFTGDTTLYAAWLSAPAAPAITAASASYNSIRVSWAAVSGAAGYEVWRAASSAGTYSKVATVTGASFTNTALTTNKAYYYKVRAYSTAGSATVYGDYSSAKAAKPVPSAPTGKAASAGYASARVTWTAVSGATGYQVYMATSKTGSYKLVSTASSSARSYTKTKLTAGKTYWFKVRAYRTVSGKKVYGGYSAVVKARPMPAAPTGVKAARVSDKSIKVSWKAVSGATKVEVWRATSANGTYARVCVTASKTWTNTGLTDGKTYFYKVRAYRTVGSSKVYGAYSPVVSAKP